MNVHPNSFFSFSGTDAEENRLIDKEEQEPALKNVKITLISLEFVAK